MTDAASPVARTLAPGAPRSRSFGAAVASWLADWSLALPLIAVATVLLLAPALAMVVASVTGDDGGFTLENWTKTFGALAAQRAVGHSLALGATVATVSALVGTPLSWLISRMTRLNRSLHLGLLNVATNFSGIGIGFAYVAALGTYGMVTLALKGLNLDVAPSQASFTGLVLAYCYTNVPLFVLLSLPAMSLLRDDWWDAAQAASATRLQFWRHVGWPVLRPFVLADWLLIFTWSVGLYGVPVALVGEHAAAYRLVTVEMYRSLYGSMFGDRRMPVYAVLLMAVAALSLITYRAVVRRGTRWLT